jgi:hypothetical protein
MLRAGGEPVIYNREGRPGIGELPPLTGRPEEMGT